MNTMKLAGVTHMNGGEFENVAIEGVAKIIGDIKCANMSVQGVATFNGSVECEAMHVEGTCKVTGGVRGNVRLAGLLNVAGSVDAESFTGAGSFQIGGALNAEKVDIRFVYGSGSSEVCGESITICKERSNAAAEFIIDLIPWRHKGRSFKTELIEGDAVDVDFVEAATVRGRDVKIGPNCSIGLLEYHGSARIDPAAAVRRTVRIGE